MSHRWNDLGGYTDLSLNPSSSSNFDASEEGYNQSLLALHHQQPQHQQRQQQQQQQQQDAFNALAPETHSVQDSPMTSYSNSGGGGGGAMDTGLDFNSSSLYESMGGGESVNPAAMMDMDYDLTGVSNVVGLPSMSSSSSLARNSFDAGPARASSMTGIEGRLSSKSQYGTTSAAEAFARLRAGSISITPSSTTTQPNLATSTSMEVGTSASNHGSKPLVPSMSLPRSKAARTSISSDLPMRAFSYPARLPQISPRQSFSGSSSNLQFPSPFPSYQSNPPYEPTPVPAYDHYGTPADTAFSLNEGSLSAFNNGIESPTTTATPTPDSYQQHSRNRSIAKAGGGYSHQPELQPQPPPPLATHHPSATTMSAAALTPLAQPSLYSASGFDLIGVLARVVGRKDPVINLGSIDMSCSFIVSDAKDPELPSIYVSESFCKLTGYNQEEILGRSCRFLQAPGDQHVRQGEKRRYTDSSAAHHLRTNLDNLHECQVSLINYQKGGKPFINLVTCIPISWNNTGEIDFIVGFQVDLVDQPAAILDKTTNGSYVVNYSVVHATIARNPSLSSADVASAIEQLEEAALGTSQQHQQHLAQPLPFDKAADSNTSIQAVREQVTTTDPGEVIDLVAQNGLAAVSNDAIRKQFMRLMVDQSDDLIHVLSLKGALLYVSPAARNLLEYEPSELLGKTLASFCHPSDIVSVQRELKDAGVSNQASVNLVYRIRRKHSGYMWFEASGRLHLEQGKGRKCVILSGRPREVYKMSWQDLERAGGMGESEFWAKVCVDGIFLTATRSASTVLGLSDDQHPNSTIVGRSFTDLAPSDQDAQGVMQALVKAAEGTPTQVQHQLVGDHGPVDVVTHFYPARTDHEEPTEPTLPAVGAKNVSIIAQVNLLSSEMAKRRGPLAAFKSARSGSQSEGSGATVVGGGGRGGGAGTTGPVTLALPAFGGRGGPAGTGAPSTTSAGSSFSAVPSTFKALGPPNAHSDNVFDELNVTRGTSWQFELHQMRLTNKKLREEKEALSAMKRKREESVKSASSVKGGNAARSCANCGRTSSAEWRSGPTGPKTLCNACGLRWSKARSQAHGNEAKKKTDASSSSATPAMVAVTATTPLPPPKKIAVTSSGSDESRPGSGSDSRGGNSTNPTTNSPASQGYTKQPFVQQAPDTHHHQLLLQPPQHFVPAPYNNNVDPTSSSAQPRFFGYPSQPPF